MARYAASVKVRFAEIDRAGIVYYPRFFHYFHIAFEEFFDEAIGTPYHVLIDEKRIGFPTVHAECDYRSPLEFGDLLDVSIAVARVGRTSVDFRYRVRRRKTGRVAAEALVTVVCVDMDSFKPVAVPEPYRSAFLRYAEGSEGPPARKKQGRRVKARRVPARKAPKRRK